MTEADLIRKILLLSRGDVRLFRNNSGKAWMGKVIKKTPTTVTLQNPRLVQFGIPGNGGADLLGWQKIPGSGIAQFLSIEVKSERGVTSDEQDAWLRIVRASGGCAAIVRSEDEARALLGL